MEKLKAELGKMIDRLEQAVDIKNAITLAYKRQHNLN
jgi:hypothetical protein